MELQLPFADDEGQLIFDYMLTPQQQGDPGEQHQQNNYKQLDFDSLSFLVELDFDQTTD